MFRRARLAAVPVLCAMLFGAAARAAEDADDEAPDPGGPAAARDLPAQSLGLRTALHSDPALEAPFERLVALYGQAGQTDALVALYRSHVAQHPDDPNGTTVLVRLLMATRHADALAAARAAADKFPEDGYLRYLLFRAMRAKGELGALDELDRAIGLETRPHRKLAWIDELLPIATVEDRRDLAQKHLAALAGLVTAPEGRLEVARNMVQFKFHELALELIDKPGAAPPPETMVALEMEAATAEVGLDRMEAAERLPKSAGIEKRTLDLLDGLHDDRAREEYLARRVKESPDRKDLVLLRVKTLYALGRRDEALGLLTGATNPLPAPDRRNQLVEMARHLRKSGMAAEAAGLYRRALDLDPARLDLRRELAKTLVSLGQRQKLAGLFRGAGEQPAGLEDLFDLMQFMLQQGLLVEARAVLAPRLEREKDNLELRLMALRVEQRLGHGAGGAAMIAACRGLCDTGALPHVARGSRGISPGVLRRRGVPPRGA